MNKILLSVLLAASLFAAEERYEYEITPVIGHEYRDSAEHMSNYNLIGFEYQYKKCLDANFTPEFFLYYGHADYDTTGTSTTLYHYTDPDTFIYYPVYVIGSQQNNSGTNIYQTGLNGVYEIKDLKNLSNSIKPFVKAGIGYEYLSNPEVGNHNGVFADTGVGVKFQVTNQVAAKVEAIQMLKFNDFRWDHLPVITAGLSYSFGKPQKSCLSGSENISNVNSDVKSDMAGTVQKTESSQSFVAETKPLPTAASADVVDAQQSCSKKLPSLHVNFKRDSYSVTKQGVKQIEKFAQFLNDHPICEVKLIGHTDSRASDEYNVKLADNRSKKIQNILTGFGVNPNRISIGGKGERMPIATNLTREGRAENRRTDVELICPNDTCLDKSSLDSEKIVVKP